ncbi:lytic polysaccharide monooxygenase [Microbulbifer sp. 2205BS26-8]|uniref:lytic polysaccharide monooxygenase n=1 Tax=Microbulbifer sp. 2205BS26-8 TaxID=3064386 RepID=UPI00273DB509|nr:lytic polysaccharide monooxygenase [Microbulbifer sp. 2205BS26-8]MDP5209208.1 lytic polysaccharide monooxygenase [Microbulbifer sp. 2205BS26-8]
MLLRTKFVIASILLLPYSLQTQAHGWSEYPKARQQICYEQGNIWSGTPPNAGCALAKSISGSYPFQQRNEFSINIPDYNNIASVRRAVPDGTLCYANDPQKRGMGAGTDAWSRVELKAGTFEYVFNATAPHNPSFWQFYLTKPNADLSKPLTWNDLDLIQEVDNVPAANGKYRMNVTIPEDRVGNAVLFVRWQRVDPAGEGFYNCSDITITNNDVDPPEEPNPDTTQPYLVQGNTFLPQEINLNSVSVGDTVKYTVFNKNGEEHSSFSLSITEDNKNDWDRLLASQVTGWYESNHNGNVFIGRWHEEMNHYMYFRNDLHGNYFNSKDSRASGQFTIIDNGSELMAVITPRVLTPPVNAKVRHGDYMVLTQGESKGDITHAQWSQVSGSQVQTSAGPDNALIIDTSSLPNIRQELTFRLTISSDAAIDEEVYSFVVEPSTITDPTDPTDPTVQKWDRSQVYTAGDVVTHNEKTWTAGWWTRGEEPGTTGQWGVWR